MAMGTVKATVRKVEGGMKVEAANRTFAIVSDNLSNGVPVALAGVVVE